jgi:hypothetical protein
MADDVLKNIFCFKHKAVQRTEISLAYFNTARLRNYATNMRQEVSDI